MAAKKLENPLSQVIPTRLDVATHNQLMNVAKRQKTSRTALVRLAVEKYLIAHETEAPTTAITA